MWCDDDFYNEPSEFEEQMDKLKESLSKSVKSEFLEEMERLRKENKNLQGIREHFEQIKKDYERKKAECDRAIHEAEQKAKRMRVNELMEHFRIFAWETTWEYLYGPKCDKCNKCRKIKITLPSGRKIDDECQCLKSETKVVVPQRMVLYEMADRDQGIAAWYKACGLKDGRYYVVDYASSVYTERLIKHGTDYDRIEKMEEQKVVLFATEEECQAYCDYLNKKHGVAGNILYKLNGELYKREEDLE